LGTRPLRYGAQDAPDNQASRGNEKRGKSLPAGSRLTAETQISGSAGVSLRVFDFCRISKGPHGLKSLCYEEARRDSLFSQ
jgi:hypothetical protein